MTEHKTANCRLMEIVDAQAANQDNEVVQALCQLFKPQAEASARQYRSFIGYRQPDFQD